jgi:AcrR family transcriptional regulator
MTDITLTTMRRQRPRGTITQDAVINAALTIVDRDRVEGLTIRAVAREVGAPPMSLYSHFVNKDELLDLMYGAIIRRLYPDHGHTTWREELLALCRHIRAVLLEHPHWTELLARGTTPLDVPVRERILAMMVAEGMTPERAWKALSGAALSSTGFVLAELTMRGQNGTSSIEQRYERLREWSQTATDVPVTTAAVAPNFDLDAVFTFTLRALVDGISTEPAPPAAEAAPNGGS